MLLSVVFVNEDSFTEPLEIPAKQNIKKLILRGFRETTIVLAQLKLLYERLKGIRLHKHIYTVTERETARQNLVCPTKFQLLLVLLKWNNFIASLKGCKLPAVIFRLFYRIQPACSTQFFS